MAELEDSQSDSIFAYPDAAAAEKAFVGVEEKGGVAAVDGEIVNQRTEAVGLELQFQMESKFLQLAVPVPAAVRAIRRVGGNEEFSGQATQALHSWGGCFHNHPFENLFRTGSDRLWLFLNLDEAEPAGGRGLFQVPQGAEVGDINPIVQSYPQESGAFLGHNPFPVNADGNAFITFHCRAR
jgi:hypothetical protein